MHLTSEEILPAIREGNCKKIRFPGFDNASYFADQTGNIYSLNNPDEPKFVAPKLGKGLLWVTLYERDAYIRKLMVGEIIAHTFLDSPDSGESTVLYRDGNPANNAVDNLQWGSRQEQQDQLRTRQMRRAEQKQEARKRDDADEQVTKKQRLEVLTGTRPVEKNAERQQDEDPLLDQLKILQARVNEHEKRNAMLTKALQPFACFDLSPAHAADFGNAVVLSANEGSNRQSKLTVHDFRFANKVFNHETLESE